MAVTLINADCEEYMKDQPANRWAIGCVDPVYGINGNSHRKNKQRGKLTGAKNYHAALWDQPITSTNYFEQLHRVTNNQLIFGGNYFEALGEPFKTPRRTELEQFLEDHPVGWILWDKVNGNIGFNDYELIWTSFKFPSFVYKYMWNGFLQGLSFEKGHIAQSNKSRNEFRIHPTQKPVNLYRFLFKKFCGTYSSVLDTHLGSASSAIAADELRLNFTGIEIDQKYFNDAKQRFENTNAQQKLF